MAEEWQIQKPRWLLQVEEGIPLHQVIDEFTVRKGPQLSDDAIDRNHVGEMKPWFDPTYPEELLIADLRTAYTEATKESEHNQRYYQSTSGGLLWRFNAIRDAVESRPGLVEKFDPDEKELFGLESLSKTQPS